MEKKNKKKKAKSINRRLPKIFSRYYSNNNEHKQNKKKQLDKTYRDQYFPKWEDR